MIYRAIVRDNRDPRKSGRLKVSIPQLTGSTPTDWIWPLVTSGFMVLPKAGEQVWVGFEAGDTENPVWLGKTAETKAYTAETQPVGDVSRLLQRVRQLETEVDNLKKEMTSAKARLTSLESKAHQH